MSTSWPTTAATRRSGSHEATGRSSSRTSTQTSAARGRRCGGRSTTSTRRERSVTSSSSSTPTRRPAAAVAGVRPAVRRRGGSRPGLLRGPRSRRHTRRCDACCGARRTPLLAPLARCSLGGTCGLFGNGMGFRADVYRRRPLTGHLTEDLELQLELILGDDVIEFVPEAIVEAEMPSTFAAARTQNERWEGGRIDLTRRFVPRLVRSAAAGRARRRFTKLDTAVDLVLPPFSVLVAATAASTAIALGGARSGRFGRMLAGVGIANVVAQAVHVLSALWMVRAPAAVYRGSRPHRPPSCGRWHCGPARCRAEPTTTGSGRHGTPDEHASHRLHSRGARRRRDDGRDGRPHRGDGRARPRHRSRPPDRHRQRGLHLQRRPGRPPDADPRPHRLVDR